MPLAPGTRFYLFLIILLAVGVPKDAAASIDLSLRDPKIGPCGSVEINGVVSTTRGDITRIAWNWGDGTRQDSFFPASHEYAQSGIYSIRVTAHSLTGEQATVRWSVGSWAW